MLDPQRAAEILAGWERDGVPARVAPLLARAAAQLRPPPRGANDPGGHAPLTRAELATMAEQVEAGSITPDLAPRLAAFLRDALTGGKQAAARWIPDARKGAPKARQSKTAERRHRINLELHHRLSLKGPKDEKGLIKTLRAMYSDYLRNRWPSQSVLISRPPARAIECRRSALATRQIGWKNRYFKRHDDAEISARYVRQTEMSFGKAKVLRPKSRML